MDVKQDIKQLTDLGYHVAQFISQNGWECTAVMTLSFADIGAYMHARSDLMRASFPARDGLIRPMSDGYGEELDICGITFRLRCLEKSVYRSGPESAVETVRAGRMAYRHNIGDWMK